MSDFEYETGAQDYADDELMVDPSAGYGSAQPNAYAPYIDPQIAEQVGAAVREVAAQAAQAEIAGPLGQLAREAERAENQRINELVEASVAELASRHPSTDFRDAEFLSFAERYGIDGATPKQLADSLEEAHTAYSAVQSRKQAAETRERQARTFARIKAATGGEFRVGGLE